MTSSTILPPSTLSPSEERLLLRLEKKYEAMAPPPREPTSQWADENRDLPPGVAESGRWRTDRVPYAREPMDTIGDRTTPEVALWWGTQMSKTESGIVNPILEKIHRDPIPAMIVQPTENRVKDFMKDKLNPAIRATPAVADIISDDTLYEKEYGDVRLTLGWANSASSLSSRAIGFLGMDEIDKYPDDVDGEGDPISLAKERTITYPDSTTVYASTCSLAGKSKIEKLYNRSDQRKYWIPCPHCGKDQILKFGNIIWGKDEEGNHLPETALYHCEHCGASITDGQKLVALKKGRWIAEKTV